MMDFLRYGISLTNFYEPVAPFIKEVLTTSGQNKLVELCAGGGGGILKMLQYLDALDCHPQVLLTDLYPNISTYEKLREATGGQTDFVAESVDALQVPADLKGFRVLFSSFHHFKPEAAKKILANAVNNKEPIAVFDAGNKGIFTMLFGIILAQPVAFFILTPFFKPFRWSRLLFTYLVPLIPLCTIWDGCVSVMRFYRVESLIKLTQQLDGSDYFWKAGQVKNKWGLKVNYLIGQPEAAKNPTTNDSI